jgi:hypothetical protein
MNIDEINKEIVKFEILLLEKKSELVVIVKASDSGILEIDQRDIIDELEESEELNAIDDRGIFINRINLAQKEIENAKEKLEELKAKRQEAIQKETEVIILVEESERKFSEQSSIGSMDIGE